MSTKKIEPVYFCSAGGDFTGRGKTPQDAFEDLQYIEDTPYQDCKFYKGTEIEVQLVETAEVVVKQKLQAVLK